MTRSLRIAPDFGLPAAEAVTQTFAVLGKRGAGKTTTAAVLTEELLKAGAQIVVIDPLDGWWGLRLAADGKAPGFPIHVFGGIHGDLPLEATAGALLADVVVDEGLPLVLSLGQLSKTDMRRFVTDFCERLYRRKAEAEHRTPLHVVIDEADLFVPQERHAGLERLLGAVADLYLRGRSRGIGGTLITQRPARIHKDALSEVEVLVCHRLISPQDRKAVEAWIEAHDVLGQRKQFMESLAGLPVGTAWFWSPGWLDVFQRVKVRSRETFDSSATPTGAPARVAKTRLAPVDLERLRTRMAETIERAKAEDPRELRRQLAEVRAELVRAKAAVPTAPPAKTHRVEIPVWRESQLVRLEAEGTRARALGERLLAHGHALLEESRQARARGVATPPVSSRAAAMRAAQATGGNPLHHPTAVVVSRQSVGAAPDLQLGRGGDYRMLVALAQVPEGMSDGRLALRTGITKGGGTFRTYLGKLRQAGYVEGGRAHLRITPAGLVAVGTFEPLPTGLALIDYWRRDLGESGMRAMFDGLVEAYPKPLTKTQLAERTGIAEAGGTFRTYLGKLRTLGLVEGRGELRAAEELFL